MKKEKRMSYHYSPSVTIFCGESRTLLPVVRAMLYRLTLVLPGFSGIMRFIYFIYSSSFRSFSYVLIYFNNFYMLSYTFPITR